MSYTQEYSNTNAEHFLSSVTAQKEFLRLFVVVLSFIHSHIVLLAINMFVAIFTSILNMIFRHL